MHMRILIPLDGSKVGEAALPVVTDFIVKLAPEVKVSITLVGVITRLTHWVAVGEASAPVSYTDEELNLIKRRVTEYLKKTGETLKDQRISVSIRVHTGSAAEEIIKVSDEIKADMIAMSSHGRSGLSRLAFGSITDKVLRGSNAPVLVVTAPEGTRND